MDLASGQLLSWLVIAGVGGGICFAFRSYGAAGVSLLLAYTTLLVSTQLSVSWVVRGLGFPHAPFLTLLQSVSLWLVTSLLNGSRVVLESDGVTAMPIWSRRFRHFYARCVLPIAAVHGLCVPANNASLQFIAPGFNAVLGSMSPVVTGSIGAVFWGLRLAVRQWMALLVATAGGSLAVNGGLGASSSMSGPGEGGGGASLGVLLAFGALLCRSLAHLLMQFAMCPRQKADDAQAPEHPELPPLQLLALQTPAEVVVQVLLVSMDPSGFGAPVRRLLALDLPLLGGLAVNIVSANLLSLFGTRALKMVGATAMQMCGKCSIFIVMALSSAYGGEQMHAQVLLGAMMILGAVSLYAPGGTPSKSVAPGAAAASGLRASPPAGDGALQV